MKKNGTVSLNQIKSTFQTTDLASKGKKPTVEDALAQDIEEGSKLIEDGSDDEYNPDDLIEEEGAIWDEDENICSKEDMSIQDEDSDQSEEEEEEPKEPTLD